MKKIIASLVVMICLLVMSAPAFALAPISTSIHLSNSSFTKDVFGTSSLYDDDAWTPSMSSFWNLLNLWF